MSKLMMVFGVIAALIVIAVGLIFYTIKYWESDDRAATKRLQALAKEFAVGKPVQGFIQKAKNAGCIDFWIVPERPEKNVSPDALSATGFGPEGMKNFDRDVNILDDKFQKIPSGTIIGRLKLHFPLATKGCAVQYVDGKATVARVID